MSIAEQAQIVVSSLNRGKKQREPRGERREGGWGGRGAERGEREEGKEGRRGGGGGGERGGGGGGGGGAERGEKRRGKKEGCVFHVPALEINTFEHGTREIYLHKPHHLSTQIQSPAESASMLPWDRVSINPSLISITLKFCGTWISISTNFPWAIFSWLVL